ncbi:MAG: TonB family protein [Actinomycetota bacterium]
MPFERSVPNMSSLARDFFLANKLTGQPIWAISTSFGLHGLLLLVLLPKLNLYPEKVNLNAPVRVVELNAAEIRRLPQPTPPPSLNPRFSIKPLPTPSNVFPTIPPAPPSLTLPTVPPAPPSFSLPPQPSSLKLPPLPPGGSLPASPPPNVISSARLPSSGPPLLTPYPLVPPPPPRLNIPSPSTAPTPNDPFSPNMSQEEQKIRQRLIETLGQDVDTAKINYGDRGRSTSSPSPTTPSPRATAPTGKDTSKGSRLADSDLASALREGISVEEWRRRHPEANNGLQPGSPSRREEANLDFATAYIAMFQRFRSAYADLEMTQPTPMGAGYPPEACPNKLEGQAVVGALVKPEGRIAAAPELLASSGNLVLDRVAVDAATDVAFSPTRSPKLYQLVVNFKYDAKTCSAGVPGQPTPASPQPSPAGRQPTPASPQPTPAPESASPSPQPSPAPESAPSSPGPTPEEQSTPAPSEPTPATGSSATPSPQSSPAPEQSPPPSPTPSPSPEESPQQ